MSWHYVYFTALDHGEEGSEREVSIGQGLMNLLLVHIVLTGIVDELSRGVFVECTDRWRLELIEHSGYVPLSEFSELLHSCWLLRSAEMAG